MQQDVDGVAIIARQSRAVWRLESPVFAWGLWNQFPGGCPGPGVNPAAQKYNFIGFQGRPVFGRRHAFFAHVLNALDEQAVRRLTRYDDFALEHEVARIQAQLRLLLERTVTGIAFRGEEFLHLLVVLLKCRGGDFLLPGKREHG